MREREREIERERWRDDRALLISEPRLRPPQLCPVVGALPGNVSHPSL